MRPKCHCGKIAGYWYGPIVYEKMNFEEYINNHAFCEEHADVDDWAEYLWVGFHKKDWQWLKKKKTTENLIHHNRRMDLPGWTASHVKDGVRWHLGLYGGYHGFGGCETLEDVVKCTSQYQDVIIEERKNGR